MNRPTHNESEQRLRRRLQVVVAAFAVVAVTLAARAVELQVLDSRFLADQGRARHVRIARISANRGEIVDRHGEPLAVSTPVDSIWADPRELAQATGRLPAVARALGRETSWLKHRITRNVDREFVYLRRHMRPEDAAEVVRLGVPGVHVLREYRRYYPAGEVTGHLLGFTNIDDAGQEGLELAYDHWLAGQPGAKRVLQDRYGRFVEDIERIEAPRPGRTLLASIDLRIQYLAYRELKAAVFAHRARAGAIVVVDIATGEVLAMVNQPSFNPNDRAQLVVSRYRNRAATDIFEPGSSFKPFVLAAAIERGPYGAASLVDTTPGFLRVGAKTIRDKHNLGRIDLATVLTKSSNVGAVKIALTLEPEDLWETLVRFGFGRVTATGYPGESAGLLNHHQHWRKIGQATLAYGYGVSVTALQLAQAYAAIGADGLARPTSLVRIDRPPPGERVVSAQTARELIEMMETVVAPEGTARRAAVRGYRIAGKTGTAWKSSDGGYSEHRYVSIFAGLAPATAPRLAAVVVIDEPGGEDYYGGDVAAPVFSAVMAGALRLLALPPDDTGDNPLLQIVHLARRP